LGSVQLWFDRSDYVGSDLILQHENVGDGPIVALCPDLVATCGVNKLSGHPQPLACLPDATFEYVTNAEFARDLADIRHLSLVRECRVSRDHEEASQFR